MYVTDFLVLKNPRLDHIIQGLGCEGAELTNAYWTILRQRNLVHTAEEEEYRRFTAAPPVTAAELDSAFAMLVRRLFSACVRACPKTNGIAVNFVKAGQLHLQLFYSEAERLLRVHDRWLSARGAIEELGLPDDLVEADIVFHTVKTLFADALEQLPREVFVEDNSKTAEWRKKLEVSRAEQRLLNYWRMGDLIVDTVPGPGLHLRWDVDPRQSFDTSVEIQCHRASQCSHLWDSLLIAEDARTDKMTCIAVWDEDDSEQRTGQAGLTNPRLPPCRSYRYSYSRGEHYEYNLEEGEEYFFVLVMPTDPGSFIEPELARINGNPPLAEVLSAETEPSVVDASALATTTAPAGSFALGPRLRTLDIFQIDRERWYEARSSENVQAVIGILSGEKFLSAETRKRPRMD
ncbi:hypothetical protein VTI74DRAFT_3798 [Chaetomium olivicolor]